MDRRAAAGRPLGVLARRSSRRLRIGLIQGVCAAGGLVLALASVRADAEPLFPEAAIVPLMIGTAFSIVGLVTIIFSLLFTVVQWVYGTFSLRLRRFEDRPLAWWAFGVSIGMFVYSLVAALLTARRNEVSWVVPAGTFLGALVILLLLRRLQLDAFTSVQLGPTLMDLCERGLAAIDARSPADPVAAGQPDAASASATRGAFDHPREAAVEVVWHGSPCVLQQIDERRLVQLAVGAGVFVRLTVSVGAVLVPGSPVAEVHGSPHVVDLRGALITGTERTTQQDPQWVLRLLTDIALKALSPAINDPATAVQALDCLDLLLARLVRRERATGALRAADGTVVVEIPEPTLHEMLGDLLDDLIVAAAPLPSAARRLGRLLDDLQRHVPAGDVAAVVAAREELRRRTAAASPPGRGRPGAG